MHANDLLDEKYLYQAGREVEFFVEIGDKGPKASQIRLVHQSSSHKLVRETPAPSVHRSEPREDGEEGVCDVLSVAELQSELTEALVGADGSLTADQIKRVRTRVIGMAREHGWIES